jgi:tetratricopeptide (TPR) repeat protein
MELRVTGSVDTVVQVGRVVVEPGVGRLDGVPSALPGREREIAATVRLVEAGAPGVLVHGAPGLGTTAVALAAAARLAPRFAGGARFVPAAADPWAVLAAALGIRGPSEARRLREALADHPTLLVLDDVRTAEQVRAALPHGRSALVAVAAQALPDLELDGVRAVGLEAISPADPPAGVDEEAVRACGGSPLALRLAAAGSGTLTGGTLCPRRAARAALAALGPAERAVLDAAAVVVRAGSPLVEPAGVRGLVGAALSAEEVAAALRSLRERGLLSARPGPEGLTCGIPTAVREVLPRPSIAVNASAATRSAPGAPTTPGSPGPPVVVPTAPEVSAPGAEVAEALAAVRRRLDAPERPVDPVRAALASVRAAETAGSAAELVRATLDLATALARTPGREAEAQAAYDTALLAVAQARGPDLALHAAVLHGRGVLAARRDRPAAALADLRAAVALHRTTGATVAAARAWQEIADVERAAGDHPRAVAAHRSALVLYAEQGDPLARSWARLAEATVQVGVGGGRAVARLPESPAWRSVRALAELDPGAPDPVLLASSF